MSFRKYLFLFDIDGTLILSGGAGLRALNQTFHELFQVQDAFAGITTAGRTDGEIIDEALRKSQITSTEAVLVEIQRRYEADSQKKFNCQVRGKALCQALRIS